MTKTQQPLYSITIFGSAITHVQGTLDGDARGELGWVIECIRFFLNLSGEEEISNIPAIDRVSLFQPKFTPGDVSTLSYWGETLWDTEPPISGYLWTFHTYLLNDEQKDVIMKILQKLG